MDFVSQMSDGDCSIYPTILNKLYGYDLSQQPKCCDNAMTECNGTRITKIVLTSFKLQGFIPPELDRLTQLQVLHLGNNQLKGPIPAELGKLKELQFFEAQNNLLTDGIPKELGQLTKLRDLMLQNNSLTGFVPQELENCKNLTQL